MAENPKVLSIQSHVVSGYVGNKSATFPLQLLGFEVDAINSVQFCNHTGYKKVAGQILSEKDLDDLAGGLQQNGLDFYSHLLTGYIGAESFLRRVCSLVKHLKSVNPNLIYGITQTVRNFVQIKCFCCSL
jgi:pyridoxine kinase